MRIYVDRGQPRLCVGTGAQHALRAYLQRSGLINADDLRRHEMKAKSSELRLEVLHSKRSDDRAQVA